VLLAAVLTGTVAVLLVRGTMAIAGRLGGDSIHRIITETEYIVERHAVPPAWQAELARHARPTHACLRRLDRLIAFSRTTSVVADEETRSILLSELTQVRSEWESATWDQMCAPGSAAHTGDFRRGSG
jgi:hypothetical protein